jgi:CubicO group peptidase (beta-lactamase class C family)
MMKAPMVRSTLHRFVALAFCATALAQTRTERLDELFAKFDQPDAPGLAAMLIVDGKPEYRRTIGLANLDTHAPITKDTQFLLASVSKQFTAMAIMILAERGKLAIDDTLAKYCPEFPHYAETITIRHLLNHISGLPDYEKLLVGDVVFSSSKSPPAVREYSAKDALTILSRQQELRFSPGAKFEYSNSGYVVLGQIVERASGQRFAEFLRENIFKPLAMNDTLVVDERKQKPARLALGYGKKNGEWTDITYSPLNAIYGEDNVVTTIEDMYKWDQALYTDRLVSRAMLDMAFTPGHPAAGASTYGFGWQIRSIDGDPAEEHGGGWSGYRTYILRVPKRHMTAIVLTNSSNNEAGGLAHRMIQAASK